MEILVKVSVVRHLCIRGRSLKSILAVRSYMPYLFHYQIWKKPCCICQSMRIICNALIILNLSMTFTWWSVFLHKNGRFCRLQPLETFLASTFTISTALLFFEKRTKALELEEISRGRISLLCLETGYVQWCASIWRVQLNWRIRNFLAKLNIFFSQISCLDLLEKNAHSGQGYISKIAYVVSPLVVTLLASPHI